jgi:hypothetical protein
VRDGEIYPVSFNEGDECPEDLIEVARRHEALEVPETNVKGKRRVPTDA